MLPRSQVAKDPFRKVTPRVERLIVYFKKKLVDRGAKRIKSILLSFRIDLCETVISEVWKKVESIRKSGKNVSSTVKT